ncbi:MAG: pseudouridine synthase [Verrucomicrobia bacterium RIFCSPHIGHO2_12_FULL_41_10]|nr:MAG: pseudouridine synthase [Verrucomicrobia bacterium RIFCSPHIGHO2_12_FULL_41_10]HLB34759.1 pseudouridine synthase [Chthoniobacterales bacterium]
MLLAFHKPYGCLSQFTKDGSPHQPLVDFNFPPQVYAIGRLDADSEGLLLLSDEPGLNTLLLDPKNTHKRYYWAQVEGVPTIQALKKIEEGITIQDYQTLPARSWILDPQPVLAPRIPPIRMRKTIPDSWIALELIEGKNRQVRRMTAAVGYPTLRLIRVRIGNFELSDLAVGTWRELNEKERAQVMDET